MSQNLVAKNPVSQVSIEWIREMSLANPFGRSFSVGTPGNIQPSLERRLAVRVTHRLGRVGPYLLLGIVIFAVPSGAARGDATEACHELQLRYEVEKSTMTAIEVSTMLFSAADNGCAQLLASLLDNGASYDARDRFGAKPLNHAAHAGQLPSVRLLLERGAPIDARNVAGASALFAAIEANRPAVARELIQCGADVNLTGRSDLSPLAVAAFNRDDALVGLLLAAGAEATAMDKTGKTPIVYAAARGALAVVARLLDHGIDVNARYGNGLTALMWAAGHDDAIAVVDGTKVASLLLDRGAHIDDRDFRGRTALMVAAEQEDAEMVELLMSRGADPRSQDNAGKAAADLTARTPLRERLLRR
jgi:ankyrin repeat protein